MKIVGKHKPLRFAVGSPDNVRSSIWRVSARKSDVYVTTLGRSAAKLSFHESGVCRDAFTSEYGIPAGMHDRAMHKWRRAATPPPDAGGACLVFQLFVPSDFLSDRLNCPAKEIHWIDAAALGRSTCIQMFFSSHRPDVAEQLILVGTRTPLAGFQLQNGSWFYVAKDETNFAGQEMRVPAAGKRKFDFSIVRGPTLKREFRFFMSSRPVDGETMLAWEYGAARCEQSATFVVDGTLTPNRIYDSTDWNV